VAPPVVEGLHEDPVAVAENWSCVAVVNHVMTGESPAWQHVDAVDALRAGAAVNDPAVAGSNAELSVAGHGGYSTVLVEEVVVEEAVVLAVVVV